LTLSAISKDEEGGTSPTLEQLLRSYRRMPVVIYERVKTAQYLRFFKRYRRNLVFVGNVNVLRILLLGLAGYSYLLGTRYGSVVTDGLLGIFATAKLDEEMYHVTEWFQKKNRLEIYIMKRLDALGSTSLGRVADEFA
jgi:hypothetical protein